MSPRLQTCAAGLCTMGVLLAVSCTPSPAPIEPFTEFTVTQQGGEAGLSNPLLVRPDGIAVLMSQQPTSGLIPSADLDRLRVLLTSEQFRSEAAANAEKTPVQGCADDITWSVTMGALTVSSGGECSGNSAPTPVSDEVIRLLADEVDGTFAAAVPAGGPELVPFTIDRQATQYYPAATFSSTATGKVTMETAHRTDQTRAMKTKQRDTLRLLLDRQVSRPVTVCEHPGPYRLRIGGPRASTVTYCVGGPSTRELLATIALVENLFES